MRDIIDRNRWEFFACGVLVAVLIGVIYLTVMKKLFVDHPAKSPLNSFNKELIGQALSTAIKSNEFPLRVDIPVNGETKHTLVEYSFDAASQDFADKLFKSYRPDYGALVALDAQTGRILAMVSATREERHMGNMALRAMFPTASVFKVITASAAIDQHKISPDTIIPFNGRSHTLYKRNVEDTKVNRWTRYMTVREAFGKSINTIFGKVGAFYIGPQSLREYAERFKFNNSVPTDVPLEPAQILIPDDDADHFGVAEAASGYTREARMSPLQGALIASAVANDGVMMEPYLVRTLFSEDSKVLYEPTIKAMSVTMSPESAVAVRSLMKETIEHGTSRTQFRDFLRKKAFMDVEVGGKTGSLSSRDPDGHCDWFVGYARMRNQKIAVAAVTVHEKLWRVRSSVLVERFLENYIMRSQSDERAQMALGNLKELRDQPGDR